MPPASSLIPLLEASVRRVPDAPALLAPGQPDLSYAALAESIRAAGRSLRERGVGRNDRVAIVMENGPGMAATFLGVASHATAAPLNPTYREAELDFYLSDLDARALVTSADLDSPARRVAQGKGIPVFDLVSYGNDGPFRLEGEGRATVLPRSASGRPTSPSCSTRPGPRRAPSRSR